MQMVERRLLTSDFVNKIALPAQGEIWISDTKLRGFGLRIWRSQHGEGKAFAIRIVDKSGRKIRRTYDGEARNEYWPPYYDRRTLGDAIESARAWAADEISRAKGRRTLKDEKRFHRDRIDKRISQSTLDSLVRARFRGMRARGLTERYIDTLTKLYEQHIPKELRQKKTARVKPSTIARILRKLEQKPGLARTLRSFLGQIIKDAGDHSFTLRRAFYLSRSISYPQKKRYPHPYEDNFGEPLFQRIFSCLAENRKNWLQARFIHLLFEFGAPADRLMKAEWVHISEDRWYPWLQGERKYWSLHSRRIDSVTRSLLDDLRARATNQFGESPFLFPSAQSKTGHIRSYQVAWLDVAAKCRLDPKMLQRLIRSYQWRIVARRWERARPEYGRIVQMRSSRPE